MPPEVCMNSPQNVKLLPNVVTLPQARPQSTRMRQFCLGFFVSANICPFKEREKEREHFPSRVICLRSGKYAGRIPIFAAAWWYMLLYHEWYIDWQVEMCSTRHLHIFSDQRNAVRIMVGSWDDYKKVVNTMS